MGMKKVERTVVRGSVTMSSDGSRRTDLTFWLRGPGLANEQMSGLSDVEVEDVVGSLEKAIEDVRKIQAIGKVPEKGKVR